MTVWTATPSIGYMEPEGAAAFGTSQFAAAGGLMFWSGVVPMSETEEVIAPGDMAGQVEYVLNTLEEALLAVESSKENIVSLTVYTTDVDRLLEAFSTSYSPWIGATKPALTIVSVPRLAHPQHLLEVQGVAARS